MGRGKALVDSGAALEKYLAGTLNTMTVGSGGEVTRFVCGYFGCERHADRLFLAGLPPVIKLHIRGNASGQWLENSVRYLVSESGSGRPGRTVLLSKMAEALFVATLRRYMEELPPEQTGWLAGARDPVVGAALALIHGKPAHPWSMAELAAEVGASRTVVAERFAAFLGESPLGYLARWRLQLAAKLLGTTRRTVIQVAAEVGYESESAFNRAFKREFSLPPAQYRRTRGGNAASPAVESQRQR
jgi:AraC-like DNA-binding protein